MILDPSQYTNVSAYELLEAASRGEVGLDRRLLHALVDDPAKSIADMVRFGIEEDGSAPLDLEEDLIAIFRYLKTPQAIPFFVKCIRKQPDDISDDLVEALVALGSDAVDPLLALYQELGEEQGSEIAFLIASLRVRDERILKLLLEYLDFNATDGAFCLGMYGDPAARPALEKILAETNPQDSEDSGLRGELKEAMDRLSEGAAEPERLPELDLWEMYSETDEPRFDLMDEDERIAFLGSPLAEYRAAAAESLSDGEEQSPQVRKRLLAVAREDAVPKVRGCAWEALADSIEDKETRKALVERLGDESVPIEERAGALVGLASEIEDADVRKWVVPFYDIPAVRARAMRAMWRSFDREFAKFFPPHLDDADPDVRHEAIRGIGHLRLSAESHRLKPFFNDEDFRPDALFSYAMAVPFDLTRGRAYRLMRNVDEAAGGLSLGERELVEMAIDERLVLNGHRPVFAAEEEEPPEQEPAIAAKVGRNDPCPCGSGKKYKKCCGQSPAIQP